MSRPNIGDLIPIGAIGNVKENEVLTGKTYSSDEGVDLLGKMLNNGNISGTITTQGGSIDISEGYYSGGSISANFANLVAGNIRNGVTVGGVRGYYSGTQASTGTAYMGRTTTMNIGFNPSTIIAYTTSGSNRALMVDGATGRWFAQGFIPDTGNIVKAYSGGVVTLTLDGGSSIPSGSLKWIAI